MSRILGFPIALALTALAAPALADTRADSMAFYARANAQLIAARPRVARVELLNAIKADPSNAAAHLMQGLVYVRLGDGAAAEAEIARARASGFAIGATRHLMAEALLRQGAAQRALDEAGAGDIAPLYQGWAARLRGRAQVQLGDDAAAADAFAEALRLSPRDPEAWVDAARFRFTHDDPVGGLAAAERAVALAPRNLDALILKGELARTQYGLVAALPWFDRALAIEPDHVTALLEKAATLGDLGRMRDLLATTRHVIALDGDDPEAFYLQAVLAARARNFALARTLMRHTRGAMDGVPAVMLLNGAIDYQTGNTEQAIDGLGRLVAMQPDNPKARQLLAAAQWRAGDYAGTADTLRSVADQPAADSYSLTLMGRALEQLGDRAGAAAYLDRAALPPDDVDRAESSVAAQPQLRAGASSPDALVLLGDAYAARALYPQAAEAYRRAANISFTEPVALRMIDVLRRGGRGRAAYQVLSIFLAQNPQSVSGQLLAADLAMASGQWDQAVAILEALRRRLGDRDAAILNNLAWAYYQTGRAPDALPLAAAAHALVPANPAAADTYGWLLLATAADRPRGLALVEEAAARAPANAGVRWHLARAYAAAGRRAEARGEAQAALAMPTFADRAAAAALLTKL